MKRENKEPRLQGLKVGVWFDLDWGFKRELEVYAGSQRFGNEAGWECTFDPALHETLRSGPGEVPYDGVLGRMSQPIAEAARAAGVPMVNTWLNSPVRGIPAVLTDFEASGAMAARHLLGRGLRRFGYLGYLRLVDTRQQVQGFRATLRQQGFRCSTYRFPHSPLERNAAGWKSFATGLKKWVDTLKPPVGILVCADTYCRFLIDVCRAKGWHVPADVAVVGTGNETVICASPSPSLTSIDLGHAQKGYRAAALLDQLMAGAPQPEEPEGVPPAALVPRQSTDIFAADDPLIAGAMRFMADNSHRRMEVPDVAAAVGASRRTLERRFRAAVGRSIADEMTRLRLNRAKRRLVETDVPLKTVALDAGFRTASHFSKVFSRVEGISPSQFREDRQQVFMGQGG